MVALNKYTKPKEGRDGNARPNDLMEVMSVPTIFGPNPADNDGINLQQMEAQDVKCLRRQGEHASFSRQLPHQDFLFSCLLLFFSDTYSVFSPQTTRSLHVLLYPGSPQGCSFKQGC